MERNLQLNNVTEYNLSNEINEIKKTGYLGECLTTIFTERGSSTGFAIEQLALKQLQQTSTDYVLNAQSKGYDIENTITGEKIEVKSGKKDINICPSGMLGKSRTFNADEMDKHLDDKNFIIADASRLLNDGIVRMGYFPGSTLRPLHRKGKLTKATINKLFNQVPK